MSDITVAGGLYGERCVHPDIDELYGSGGRAAIAIARAGYAVEWHYYCPTSLARQAELTVAWKGLTHFVHDSEEQVNFLYSHALCPPTYYPGTVPQAEAFRIEAQNVLRFGMMEGGAVVRAQSCVFDPQSHNDPEAFGKNGSTAERLAIVLNDSEVLSYAAASDEASAIRTIEQKSPGSVVLVKAGADGCRVYENAQLKGTIPPYWSKRVNKIGTGDVFSAAFAAQWMLEHRTAIDAADIASRCVSHFAESRTPTVNIAELDPERKAVVQVKEGQVYIAGPIFTMAELWIINEARSAFARLGMPSFSPYHEVGYGTPAEVVPADIAGLERSTAVLAILDGCDAGTLFEVGYAVRQGTPVVALAQNPKPADLTMLKGSPSCWITDDFTTAIYQASWLARS